MPKRFLCIEIPEGEQTPGYPGGGLTPGNELPSRPPHVGGKPPGRPILPSRPDNGLPPLGGRPPHPWLPGHWEPVDPGWGKPPLWGFILGPDNGLPAPPVGPGTPPPTGPGGGGVWVPTDPDYGKPEAPCIPHPPIWAWIPERPEIEPPPTTEPTTGVNIWPEEATVLASGGQVTVSVSVYPGGSTLDWTVTGLPAWATAEPASGNASGSVVLTAAPNSTGLPQQAMIQFNDKTFTLNQGAV